MASLTKITTAILAIEGAPTGAWVPIWDVDYRQMPGSSVMGVIPGDCFTLRDLLYGLMLPSGNDAALAIARYQAGSDEAFVHEMNRSEEHTSELQSLMRISYAVFCLKKKTKNIIDTTHHSATV